MPRQKTDNWKEMAVQKISSAFRNNFGKVIIIVILAGMFAGGVGISTCKGTKYETNINIEPVLKDGQVRK